MADEFAPMFVLFMVVQGNRTGTRHRAVQRGASNSGKGAFVSSVASVPNARPTHDASSSITFQAIKGELPEQIEAAAAAAAADKPL